MPVDYHRLQAELLAAELVVIASPAAAHWLLAHHAHAPDWLPQSQSWLTPGGGTAELLRQWGVVAIHPHRAHNATAMLELLPPRGCEREKRKMLWIGSKGGALTRIKLPENLTCRQLVSHRVMALDYNCDQLRPFAGHQWLISSRVALSHAHQLCQACKLAPLLLVTSPRLGGIAGRLGYTHSPANSTAPEQLLKALFKD